MFEVHGELLTLPVVVWLACIREYS